MGRGRGHYQHVVRVGGLFAAGFAVFLIVRWALIPDGFGVYGFYRAGALDDNRNLPAAFAGQQLCVDCHTDVDALRQDGGHGLVKCEACHGPLARHASGDFEIRPRALNPRLLCLGCHAQLAGKPAAFPQIVFEEHFGDTCIDCHRPHRPGFDIQLPQDP